MSGVLFNNLLDCHFKDQVKVTDKNIVAIVNFTTRATNNSEFSSNNQKERAEIIFQPTQFLPNPLEHRLQHIELINEDIFLM